MKAKLKNERREGRKKGNGKINVTRIGMANRMMKLVSLVGLQNPSKPEP